MMGTTGTINMAGIIFANMHDTNISDLTKLRSMGSVPFGARYRLIDFPLSNMVNSGISSVGVVTESNYQSLLDHLSSAGEWDLTRKTGGLRMLPPYGNTVIGSNPREGDGDIPQRGGLYRGRLDALANVIRFIKNVKAEYIVMSDCDIIANIDYKPVLNFHIEKGADITVIYGRKGFDEIGDIKSKTVLTITGDDRISDVLVDIECDHNETACPKTAGGRANVSMNMYIIGRDFLIDLVKNAKSRGLYNFEVDIIQHRCRELKIYGFEYKGRYAQIDSLTSYMKANTKLVDFDTRNEVFNPDKPIYTRVRDEAPAKYGITACVTNSLIADGCIIEGTVEDSVLFRGVRVGKGSVVKNSIIMQESVIGENCELSFVIADKDVVVENNRSRLASENLPTFVDKGVIV